MHFQDPQYTSGRYQADLHPAVSVSPAVCGLQLKRAHPRLAIAHPRYPSRCKPPCLMMSIFNSMLGNQRSTAIAAFKNQTAVFQVRRNSTWSSLSRGPSISEKTPEQSTTTHNTIDTAGFSRVSTKVLLRSLLITTVSSHWILRAPSLSILHLLTKAKGALLSVDKNPVIHGILKKTFYDHFCAGEKEGQVRDTIQQVKDTGLRGVILTHARETDARAKKKQTALEEDASSHCETIQAWKEGTLATIDMLSEGDYLAPK